MDRQRDRGRRAVLRAAIGAGAGLYLVEHTAAEPEGEEHGREDAEGEVTPGEDLMQEHGVLKRILLIYEEAIRRLDANEDLPPEAVAESAGIVRTFVEDYHEKLEETYLFPRFRKAGTLVDLVDILVAQHRGGRRLTDATIHLAALPAMRNAQERARLVESMRLFIRMYAPHEAREDTVLFPAFRRIVTANEYDALGEEFEDEEHKKFGADGFEATVDRVATIEKTLGIYDLAQFTPPLEIP
jgi:hemerythrin-like domain-containing protein